MSEGKLSLNNICEDENRGLAIKKFQKDAKRIFERLFSVACTNPRLDDFIYKYDVPVLLFSMMCPNLGLVERFFSYKDSFKFMENEMIGTIANFSSNEELVPTLYCAFRTAKPILEEKYECEIEQVGDIVFPLKIDNYEFAPNPIMEKMGDIYDSLNFNTSETLIDAESLAEYKKDYSYEILPDGISINAPKLFKLMFLAGYGDNTAMFTLIDLLTPLFRNITGGIAVLKIALVLAKSQKEKIFDHMGNLVRLIIIGMITAKIEMKSKFAEEDDEVSFSEEDIKKFSESFKFTDNLVNGIVNWIKGALLMLDKNASGIKVDKYKEVFFGMCDSLYAYEQEINRSDVLVHDIQKQTDLMVTIVGLCKGNYRKVEVIGVQVGCFENQKVRELMNILNKYKTIMFRGNVFGLPAFAIPSKASNVMGDIKDGLGKAWDGTKAGAKTAGKATVAGAKAAMNGIGNGLSAAGNAISNININPPSVGNIGSIGSYGGGVTMPGFPNMPGVKKMKIPSLGKVPRLMPNLSSLDPGKLVFGDIFKQFDKDKSGYIDYNEFCELCKYMGLFLDKEESLKLFSMADRNNNNQIDMREFKYAMALLKLRIAYETLRKLGLTIEDLVWYGVFGLIFLVLVLVFIFLGITAFSKAEGFNAVINSLLPLTAGVASAARRIDIQGSIEKIKDFVQKAVSKLKNK